MITSHTGKLEASLGYPKPSLKNKTINKQADGLWGRRFRGGCCGRARVKVNFSSLRDRTLCRVSQGAREFQGLSWQTCHQSIHYVPWGGCEIKDKAHL